jgi:hypothetical protein
MSDSADEEDYKGPSEEEQKAARKAQSQRLNQIMWAYLCGAITWLSFIVGLWTTYIPLGFGALGCVLAWQLMSKGIQRHAIIAGAITWAGIIAWFTANWPSIAPHLHL